MTALSSKKILQEQNTNDPNSITSLTLTHKALTDVSCLGEFKNLERLDLGFNNLTSLEGLKSCTNLKWLSVVQNKLQNLKGIDGLNRLTVLNAGKNKLKSMDDVKSLSSLRALILNDNEISSVCKLDQMKVLNTLVLSRNPISSLGESLVKLKSITKLSLSNCQLQKVDSSLRSCLELKELRLAHNEIMIIPNEFRHLVRLQNLDLGNNLIARWSNLKVKKLLPNLHMFNSRPINKIAAKEVREIAVDFSVEAGNELNRRGKTKESMDDLDSRNKRKELQDEKGIDYAENTNISDKRKKKRSKLQQEEIGITNNVEALNGNPEEVKDIKHKKKKSRETSTVDAVNIIDSAENPFTKAADNKLDCKMDQAIDAMSVVVTYPTKKKRSVDDPAMHELSQVDEIGLGGPSSWDV